MKLKKILGKLHDLRNIDPELSKGTLLVGAALVKYVTRFGHWPHEGPRTLNKNTNVTPECFRDAWIDFTERLSENLGDVSTLIGELRFFVSVQKTISAADLDLAKKELPLVAMAIGGKKYRNCCAKKETNNGRIEEVA